MLSGCSDGATVDVDSKKICEYQLVLQQMRRLWPQFDIDGVHNVWIVKPGDKSKGVGESEAWCVWVCVCVGGGSEVSDLLQ